MELKKKIEKLKNVFAKKIDQEDLKDIKKRMELRDQHILIAQALDRELQGFLNSKMTKYGLDGNKNWNFDVKSGTIKEQSQPQPSQPSQNNL